MCIDLLVYGVFGFNLGCWCWFLFCVVIYTDCSGAVVYTFVLLLCLLCRYLLTVMFAAVCGFVVLVSAVLGLACYLFYFDVFVFAFVGLLAVVYGCLGELFVGLGF